MPLQGPLGVPGLGPPGGNPGVRSFPARQMVVVP